MHSGEITLTPGEVRRDVLDEDVQPVRNALGPILPELSSAPVADSGICLFTNTPDHDFIIDFHPRYPEVLISSPCSGHGFKFASVIGEIQADLLTTGSTRFDISAFEIGRFDSKVSSLRSPTRAVTAGITKRPPRPPRSSIHRSAGVPSMHATVFWGKTELRFLPLFPQSIPAVLGGLGGLAVLPLTNRVGSRSEIPPRIAPFRDGGQNWCPGTRSNRSPPSVHS